jgi:hypothetical protein
LSTGGNLGEAMAKSLVVCLGADCVTAAALAAAADVRRGGLLDLFILSGLPRSSLERVAADFEGRGWLVKQGDAWHVPGMGMPSAVPSFLAGMAAMRGPAAAEEAALTAVTLPPPPSAIAAALPALGLSYASLISTEEAMERVADAAVSRLTIMSPFLNKGGLDFAIGLFERSAAPIKTLVVRGTGSTRTALRPERDRLQLLRVGILDCLLPTADGYETSHAKVVLADDRLAYVGSANLLTQLHHSMELGNVVQGRAARVVANVVRAVEAVSPPWDWHR